MENNNNKITYIYRIYNKKSKKNYIWKTNRNVHIRFIEHFNKLNSDLEKDLRKYWMKSFIFSILEEIKNQDENYILEREQYYINYFNSIDNWYNKKNNFLNEDKYTRFSKSIFNLENKKSYINLSSIYDIIWSYHIWQELINIYNEYKKDIKLKDEKIKIKDIEYIRTIKDHISIFIEEWVIDSVNLRLLHLILKDFTWNNKELKEKKELLKTINNLEVITFNFYETKEERRQRIKELYEKWYTRREINIITWIKNSIISNDLQYLYKNINRNRPLYKKTIKFNLFWKECNFRFTIKKSNNE